MSLTFEEQLEAVPLCNTKAVVEKDTESYIIIRVELKYSGFAGLMTKLFNPRKSKAYQLYGLGMVIYRQIAEEQVKIRDLIYWLRDNYKLSFFESRNLILQFTGDLMQKGLIVVEKSY